jgi:glycosyltransferase involved in cell wall biosynthesis
MHVVVVGNRFPWPLRDGGAQATYGMLKSLTASGVNVTYFSFNTVKHRIGHEVLTREFDFISYRAIPKKSTATVFGALVNLLTKKSYHVARYYDKAGSLELQQLLEDLENPVVWVEGLYSVPLIEPLLPWLKERNLAVVYRSHNVEYQIWERVAIASGNPIKKWYLQIQSSRLKKYEERAWTWFNFLLPITEDDERVMQTVLEATVNLSAGNLNVTSSVAEVRAPKFQLYQPGFWDIERRIEAVKKKIEAGVEQEGQENNAQKDGADLVASAVIGKNILSFADSLSAKNNRCFHIGSMEWEANKQSVQWFLRECWPRVMEKNPQAEFHLAGKGLVKDDYTYFGVGVFVHGEVESSEEFMMANGIAVVPLLSGSGIRMKILEAMLYGCPVVTTNIGMQGLSVTPGLELRVADSASSFADQVVTLMSDASLVNHQRKASWEFLGKYHNESENIQRVLGMISKG